MSLVTIRSGDDQGGNSFAPPENFVELVRDAMLHLYDLAHLQTHPLLAVDTGIGVPVPARGGSLRQELVNAIEVLRPGPGVASTSRAWRAYRILQSRYIEGHDVAEVAEQVALSRAQYHRELSRSLQEVAMILWERWRLSDRWTTPADGTHLEDMASLDPARAEAERLLPEQNGGRIDPSDVLRGVLDLLRALCVRRGVALRVSCSEQLPPIRGERVALRHALLSILSRAIALSDGGTLEVMTMRRPGLVEIKITGQASSTHPDGLGLSDSRAFVAALKGELTYLPPPEQSGSWIVSLCFPTDACRTLVVVDNSPDFIRLVERFLVGCGWEIIGASDTDQAFALARQQHPQAILLDVVIPGRDGWDLLQELRSDTSTRNIPVIICSVLHEPDVAVSLGATGYLQKPIRQRQLVDALNPYG